MQIKEKIGESIMHNYEENYRIEILLNAIHKQKKNHQPCHVEEKQPETECAALMNWRKQMK